MNKSIKNKIAMYKAVRTAIENHNAAWNSLSAFTPLYNEFIAQLSLLQTKAYEQALVTVGVSAIKEQKRETVADIAFSMASSITAFAVVNDKPELIAQVKISRWELLKTNKVRCLQLVDQVIEKSIEHLAGLSPYGIEQQNVDDLITLREELEGLLNAPRNAILERKFRTSQIEKIAKGIDHLLRNKLDKLVEVVRTSQPAFYEQFHNARAIIDLKAHHAPGSETPKELDDGPDKPSENGPEHPLF